jgi:hypothetical protein
VVSLIVVGCLVILNLFLAVLLGGFSESAEEDDMDFDEEDGYAPFSILSKSS